MATEPWEKYQNSENNPWDKYKQPEESNKSEAPAPKGGFPNLGKSVVNLIPNLASTAVDIGKNIVTHPVKSAENIVLGVGALPVGAAEKIIQNWGGTTGKKFLDWFGRGALNNFWQPFENQLKEKYGSYEKFKKSIEERPAEVMLDVSTALGIGGKVAGKVGMLDTAADLAKASEYTNPISLAGKAVTGAAKVISPERLYGSAMKMPLSKKWVQTLPGQEISDRQRAIGVGLANEIHSSEFGHARTIQLEKQARQAVDDVITRGSQRGEFAKTDDIIRQGLQKAYERAEKSSDPVGAKAIVDEVAEKFKAHGDTIKLADLNKIKRQLYDEVKWGGAEQTALIGQIKTMGKKGLARAAKEYMEQLHPELKDLNAKDAAFIKLQEAIERTVGREQNKDIVGLGAKVLATGGNIGMALWELTLGHRYIKESLAFAVNKARKMKGLSPLPANVIYQAGQITKGQNETPAPEAPKEEPKPATPEPPKEVVSAPTETPKAEPKPDPRERKKGETLREWSNRLYKMAELPAETESAVIVGAHGRY